MNASAVPSRRLLGRYEIVAEIARGGMGTVFLARLEGVGGFQRLVAIKLMHRHLASEMQFTHMLLDEARLAAQLHHPNAVGVIDVAESDIGLYIVMEYVDGFALDRVLDALRTTTPEKRIRIGLRIWLDAVRGLSAAHRLRDEDGNSLGIVHRDVSPQNILVGIDGAGRITDFGVARAAARITSSHPGMIKGKPCYMAPEQARAAEVDARADTFALGIVLWEILAGRMLFDIEGGAAATLLRVISDPIPLPSTVAPEAAPLDEVCAKCLERDLETRFQSGRRQFEAVESAARAAGLLATQEEVADYMQEAFADEMSARKSAIKEHLSAIRGANASTMQQSDVFAVPSLNHEQRSEAHTSAERPTQKANAGESGPWHEASEPSRQAMKVPGEAAPATTPAPQPAALVESYPAATPQPPRWKTLAFVLAIGGVLMAGAAAWVISNANDAESEALADEAATQARLEQQAQEAQEATQREHAQALAESAEREAAARAAALESADDARAAREAADSVREASASAAEAEEAARAARSERRRASRQSSMMSSNMNTSTENTAENTPTMDNAAATMQTTMQPGFENNPYLR